MLRAETSLRHEVDRAPMKIGFIGLGNVGAQLAGSLARNGFDLTVFDLAPAAVEKLVAKGARAASGPADLARDQDMVITCLPSPAASAAVMEGEGGVLEALKPGAIWAEMSTTDSAEVQRLGARVAEAGGLPIDCPVSGGCHRAATGNISIFAGCERAAFEAALPALKAMGRRLLHTGPLGSASVLKVVTNYLATANLLSVCEALTVSAKAGMDLGTAYEAIRISSGNSFVHETESQVILNGSRDINFTMDLVLKDIGLFNGLSERIGAPLELGPLFQQIFEDGAERYGPREWSPNIIKRLEEAAQVSVLADGFPAQMVDDEPEVEGEEVRRTPAPAPTAE